jgi:proteasome accessory factor C
MKTKADKDTGGAPGMLLKLFELIAILKASHWTIKKLCERFEVSKSSMYRYIELLEQAGLCVERDFHDRYYIMTTDEDPVQAQFTMEEMQIIKTLILADADHPLKSSLLKKLSLQSELNNMPRLFLKGHLGNLVEQLTHALSNKHQVILKSYHSANSDVISDRQVEPVHFGDNYGTVVALDIEEMTCKSFKLDRIGEVIETHTSFQHESKHTPLTSDIFGIGGKACTYITLHLTLRAYLLMREEFPLSVPYLKCENDIYIFFGPVSSFRGIGRFVLGLIDEVSIVEPEEFKAYVWDKVGKWNGKIRNLKKSKDTSQKNHSSKPDGV